MANRHQSTILADCRCFLYVVLALCFLGCCWSGSSERPDVVCSRSWEPAADRIAFLRRRVAFCEVVLRNNLCKICRQRFKLDAGSRPGWHAALVKLLGLGCACPLRAPMRPSKSVGTCLQPTAVILKTRSLSCLQAGRTPWRRRWRRRNRLELETTSWLRLPATSVNILNKTVAAYMGMGPDHVSQSPVGQKIMGSGASDAYVTFSPLPFIRKHFTFPGNASPRRALHTRQLHHCHLALNTASCRADLQQRVGFLRDCASWMHGVYAPEPKRLSCLEAAGSFACS